MSRDAEEKSVALLRAELADVLNAATVRGRITYVTSRGRRVAAVTPVGVAERADSGVDRELLEAAAAVVTAWEAVDGETTESGTTLPLDAALRTMRARLSLAGAVEGAAGWRLPAQPAARELDFGALDARLAAAVAAGDDRSVRDLADEVEAAGLVEIAGVLRRKTAAQLRSYWGADQEDRYTATLRAALRAAETIGTPTLTGEGSDEHVNSGPSGRCPAAPGQSVAAQHEVGGAAVAVG